MRKLAERFQRGTETIECIIKSWSYSCAKASTNRQSNQPLKIVLSISLLLRARSTLRSSTTAVDGTHIPVSPPSAERISFKIAVAILLRTSWLFVTSIFYAFYMRTECMGRKRGRFYAMDGGTQVGVNKRPWNSKELFNLRHAKLRNVVERILGSMKRRFKIPTLPRAFKTEAQMVVMLRRFAERCWEAEFKFRLYKSPLYSDFPGLQLDKFPAPVNLRQDQGSWGKDRQTVAQVSTRTKNPYMSLDSYRNVRSWSFMTSWDVQQKFRVPLRLSELPILNLGTTPTKWYRKVSFV
jgi:hypothetical protein